MKKLFKVAYHKLSRETIFPSVEIKDIKNLWIMKSETDNIEAIF